jgi:1,6-anhydro-N-acetylmuramate kinase
MAKEITYNINSTRATYYQKSLFLDDMLRSDHSIDVFIAWAVNTLTWRQMKEIGYHMTVAKNKEDQPYDNRTDMETVDA